MSVRRTLIAILLTLSWLAVGVLQTPANNRDRTVTVMTRNMYLGTDLSEVFAETTVQGVVSEVAEAFNEVEASRPEERIAKMADEIEAAGPMLVGLQEVALWRTGVPDGPASQATTTAYDYLALLLAELEARGLSYRAVVVEELFDAEVTGVFTDRAPLDVRYTDRIAILARTDLDTSQLKLDAAQSVEFGVNISFSHPILGMVTVPRGWTAVDVKMRGKNYRFINSHLESFQPPIVNFAQAAELLQVPANTSLPVILVGDFNSDAENPADPFIAYPTLLGGGFSDVWEAVRPLDPGHTWGLFLIDPSPGNFTDPTQRLDLVLVRGAITPAGADVVGEDAVADVTSPSGFRPSDHAGVVASVVLEP